ncbi:MAG TPA: hypothetical protein VNA87_03630 [Actinomycetota bacterium]|nr:hypothetical protein [Actinomycetota bacterium]
MTDFQRRASTQGRQFEEICRTVLTAAGFDCRDKKRIVDLQIEVDIPAVSSTGIEYWFNCKGSWFGDRPGLRRTDTLKKAIAEAYVARYAGDFPSVVLLTSHLPKNSGALWLSILNGSVFHDVICINDPEDVRRLSKLGAV